MSFKFKFLLQEEFSWISNSHLYSSFKNNLDIELDLEQDFPEFIYCSKYTDDVMLFLNVIRFWGIDEPPSEFYDLLFVIKLDFDNIYKFNLKDIEVFKNSGGPCINPNHEINKFLKKIEQINELTNEIDEFCKQSRGKIFVFLSNVFTFIKIKSCICKYASEFGILSCLKWAFENECPRDKNLYSLAVANGHLNCLIYLHENGCSWNEGTCSLAVTNGHLDCLIYLHY